MAQKYVLLVLAWVKSLNTIRKGVLLMITLERVRMKKWIFLFLIILPGCRTTNRVKISSELVTDKPVRTNVSYEVEW